jgi:hypothetical protein
MKSCKVRVCIIDGTDRDYGELSVGSHVRIKLKIVDEKLDAGKIVRWPGPEESIITASYLTLTVPTEEAHNYFVGKILTLTLQ